MSEVRHFHFKYPDPGALDALLRECAAPWEVTGTGRAIRIMSRGETPFRVEMILQPWGIAAHLSGQFVGFVDPLVNQLVERYGEVKVEER
ncbi:MAG: hypothetical protein OEY97_00605 [Nitrospirota bacterium]|nr:hypothetical protein [Nitrospirota bacterium]